MCGGTDFATMQRESRARKNRKTKATDCHLCNQRLTINLCDLYARCRILRRESQRQASVAIYKILSAFSVVKKSVSKNLC